MEVFKTIAEIPSYLNDKINDLNETTEIIEERLETHNPENIFESEQPMINDMIGDLSATGEFSDFCDLLEEFEIDISKYYTDDDYSIKFIERLETPDDNSEKDGTISTFGFADLIFEAINNDEEVDKNTLLEIFTSDISTSQLLEIDRYYKGRYGKDLSDVMYCAGDTSFNELLSARLDSAIDLETAKYYRNNSYNQNNVNNVQFGDLIKTSTVTETGSTSCASKQNENGQLIGEEIIERDNNGNIISRTVTQYIYDENGKPRQEIVIKYGPDGKEYLKYSSSRDANGNLIQEYLKTTYSDGTSEEKSSEYAYGDKADPNLCTHMQETLAYFSSDGTKTYESKKETQDTLLGYLKQIAYQGSTDEYGLGKIALIDNVGDLIEYLKANHIISNPEACMEEWKNNFLNSEPKVCELNKELWDSTFKELKAKINLHAYDDSFFLGALLNEAEKNRLLSDLNEAYKNKDYRKLEKVYADIHKKLYPEESSNCLTDELMDIMNSKEYYKSLNTKEVSENMKIRNNYDPNTMAPETQGEMLLYQLYEVKKQFEVAKDNLGTLDSIFSTLNTIFDAGTSEDDFLAIVDKYEEQLRNLSNLKGDEFLAAFKALAGEDFSEDTLYNMTAAQATCNYIDSQKDEDLENTIAALGLDINIKNAWKSSEQFITIFNPDGTTQTVPNKDYGVIDYNKLRTLIKENLTSSVYGASKSTPKKGLDDYEETVTNQRKFVVDLIRMSITTIAASTGVGVLGCGLASMATQMFAELMNMDAIGDKKITPKELATSLASAFVTGLVQEGQIGKSISNNILGALSKQFNIPTAILEKIITRSCSKGLGDGLKFSLGFLIDIENKTQEEKDNFFMDLLSETSDGLKEGAIIALFMLGSDKISNYITSKTHDCLMKKATKILEDGASDGINTIEEIIAKFVKTSLSSGAKGLGEAIARQDFDSEELMDSTWKEIRKKIFKDGVKSIWGKVA